MNLASIVTPQQALAWNLTPIPVIKATKKPRVKGWQRLTFTPDDWQDGDGIGLRLGLQSDGRYVYCCDADSHDATQNAPRFVGRVMRHIPADLGRKLMIARSTGGKGRYIFFATRDALPNGLLIDEHGVRAGEFLGDRRQVICPTPDRWLQGTLADIPMLDDTELDMLLTACGYRSTHTHDINGEQTLDIDDQAVEYWRTNISRLLNSDGLPTAIKKGQTYDILTGNQEIRDNSQARYNVIRGLMFVGYSDPEIVALALHFCAYGRHGRALLADIERCIFKENLKQKTSRRIYNRAIIGDAPTIQPAQPQPGIQKQPRGRPRRLTADRLHAWYVDHRDAGDVVLLTQADVAARLCVKPSTIALHERTLRRAGKISRIVTRRGRQSTSHVVVLSALTNTQQTAEQPSQTTQAADLSAINIPADQPPIYSIPNEQTAISQPAPLEGTLVYEAHCPAVLRYDDAMRAAIEAAVVEYGRVSKRRAREQFELHFAELRWNDRAYQRGLRMRTPGTYLDQLREMSTAGLHRWIRSIEDRLVRTSLDEKLKPKRVVTVQEDGDSTKPKRRPRTPAQLRADLKLVRRELIRRQRADAVNPEPEPAAAPTHPQVPSHTSVPSSPQASTSGTPIIVPFAVKRERAQLLRDIERLDPLHWADVVHAPVIDLRRIKTALLDRTQGVAHGRTP